MPEAPPVTMKTLPFKDGRSASVEVGRGGKSWEKVIPMVEATRLENRMLLVMGGWRGKRPSLFGTEHLQGA